jgi:hypothetical protein
MRWAFRGGIDDDVGWLALSGGIGQVDERVSNGDDERAERKSHLLNVAFRIGR